MSDWRWKWSIPWQFCLISGSEEIVCIVLGFVNMVLCFLFSWFTHFYCKSLLLWIVIPDVEESVHWRPHLCHILALCVPEPQSHKKSLNNNDLIICVHSIHMIRYCSCSFDIIRNVMLFISQNLFVWTNLYSFCLENGSLLCRWFLPGVLTLSYEMYMPSHIKPLYRYIDIYKYIYALFGCA